MSIRPRYSFILPLTVGIVSQKKLLSLLPFIEDPVQELEELKLERDESDERLRDEEGYPDEQAEEELLAQEGD